MVLAAILAASSLALGTQQLQAIGDFLVIRDRLRAADAVITISGDGTGERVATAAALIHQGYGRWLIISGSTGGHARGGAAASMLRGAQRAGISSHRIVVDDRSVSTQDNAEHTARLMQELGLKRAILVTSPYHTRRAAVVFRRKLVPQGLQLQVYAAEQSFFDVHQWWTRKQDRGLVIREYVKLMGVLVGIKR